jgi:hypothetical protein
MLYTPLGAAAGLALGVLVKSLDYRRLALGLGVVFAIPTLALVVLIAFG